MDLSVREDDVATGNAAGTPVRVLNVLFDDRYGGPQRRVIQVGARLAEHGVETVLVLPRRGGNAAAEAERAGLAVRLVDFERMPAPRDPVQTLRAVAGLARDVATFRALYHAERPDVVHVNGLVFLAPALAARAARVPFVWHLNDVLLPRILAVPLGRFAHRLADRVVVSAEAVAAHHGLAGRVHTTIYPPVTLPQAPAARPANDVPRIGLVANRGPAKGVEDFVRAMARVRDRWPGGIRIDIAGARLESQAGYAARIDGLIAELGLGSSLRDHGFVADVWPLLAGLDVLVQPSLAEAFGMSVLEAMSAGVPVVATRAGGLPELVLGDASLPAGVLVPRRDPGAIADAVLDLLGDRDQARRLGDNGRRRAAAFRVETAVARHRAVYAELAPSRGVAAGTRARA